MRYLLLVLLVGACGENGPELTVHGTVQVVPFTVPANSGADSSICVVLWNAVASTSDTIQYAVAASIGTDASLWSTGRGGEFVDSLSTNLVTPLADSVRPEFFWHSGRAHKEMIGLSVACDSSTKLWS
jgi:hypothetical protein